MTSTPTPVPPLCLEFRAAYPDPMDADLARHPRTCPACAAYAAALGDARARRPLPPALHDRLAAIPGRSRVESEDDDSILTMVDAPPVLSEPLPRVPLPPSLRERLVAIPQVEQEPSGSPSWWLETRPLLAASYLLACLVSGLLGGFQAFGEQAVASGTRLASVVRTSVEDLGAAEAPERLRRAPDRLRRAVGPLVEPLAPESLDLEPIVGPLRDLDDKAAATWDGWQRQWRDRREPEPAPRSLETPEPPPASQPRAEPETPSSPEGQALTAPGLSEVLS